MASLLSLNNFKKGNESGIHTSSEILQQPETWRGTWDKLKEDQKLLHFLQNAFDSDNLNIVLTGAGSSAFIGDVVKSSWKKHTDKCVEAIPTTDLVTHFEDNISTNSPLLLISFARSGNSPESTAAIDHADTLCSRVYHLIVTCNPDGKLAQMSNEDNKYVFLLPAEAEDQGLAMTNSFTSMALAANIIPKLLSEESQEKLEKQIDLLALYGSNILQEGITMLKKVAESSFDRIVFLGSGPLWGTAKESHLKVQELTNGQVVGKFDSFLGFRHGPKAIINNNTLIIYLLSNQELASKYEEDLVKQVARHNINLTTFGLAEKTKISEDIDFTITLGKEETLDEDLWAILCTLPSQIIGFYKSKSLGYNPDKPSPNGTISRVVEGVSIYNDLSKGGVTTE